ncbi:hypothetical protein GRF59_10840 [Paenibacillus sp. HJL G12]|uniref:Uncharacterized protein n=1 Tax=Paenibacillus dendrobii TaxID=2691084 RepID=A0A7X3IIG0_9BACL|nr:DUF5819 family protein [Paenibacillus dendrobii]MWV44128.1 hypothetical protein [Paenibacillus dendrobii]
MKRKILSRLVLCSLVAVSAYIFISHFFLIFLYLSPANPIKSAMNPYIHQYTQDLWAQNWSLFAPEPLHNNTGLLVKCKDEDADQESEWYNINVGMLNSLHNEPLGPFVRLSRMHLTAIRYYQGFSDPTSELYRQKICGTDPDNPVCKREDDSSKTTKEMGTKMLKRLGSVACTQLTRSNKIQDVKLRVLFAPVKPYSERMNQQWKPEIAGFETEWLKYEEVAPLPFKLASGGPAT